ncbi:glycosyltransferase family 4 protein [Mucilaginibacter sp. L196]|uniref:glycosyltransferase family 4 protein n=1 Tax=Mucilaginibacter sp. L196 TaxID=1641870 RepID=UPI00131E4341|nr:glycosyltransferase family 4 protein [Mucilaginibacter sp. L196]
MKLAVITTHAIQYYAPVFKLLHQRQNIEIKVYYTWGESSQKKHDPGFNKTVNWDISLLNDYPYEWVKNTAKNPGSHGFKGVVNPELIEQIKIYNPDAILIYGWAYQGHLKAFRYFKNKVPIYFRGDSTLLNDKKNFKSLLRSFFLRWVYSHVDHAFYVGSNNKSYFKKFNLKENQLSFAPHAIDNDRFKAGHNSEVQKLRESLKITDEDILIVYAGKFEPVKNLKTLLTAFSAIKQTNVHLLLVGNGPDEKDLRQQAETNEIKRLHFLDLVNQSYIPVIYHAADLFCLPSISESWGLAINEAMACGKAILTSNKVGCAADLVIHGKNGDIFEAGNITDLTKKLIALVQKGKTELLKMGKNSADLISTWDFETQARAIEEKLNEK